MIGFILHNNILTIGILCVKKFVSVAHGTKQLTNNKKQIQAQITNRILVQINK